MTYCLVLSYFLSHFVLLCLTLPYFDLDHLSTRLVIGGTEVEKLDLVNIDYSVSVCLYWSFSVLLCCTVLHCLALPYSVLLWQA